jgi:hypothetical protein
VFEFAILSLVALVGTSPGTATGYQRNNYHIPFLHTPSLHVPPPHAIDSDPLFYILHPFLPKPVAGTSSIFPTQIITPKLSASLPPLSLQLPKNDLDQNDQMIPQNICKYYPITAGALFRLTLS